MEGALPLPNFSTLDLKIATFTFWALYFFYSSAIWFKCKSVARVKVGLLQNQSIRLQSKYGGCVTFWWRSKSIAVSTMRRQEGRSVARRNAELSESEVQG